MVRNARLLPTTLAATLLVLLGAGRGTAQCVTPPVVVVPAPRVAYAPPVVSYYAPAPTVTYYAPAPTVAYYPATVAYSAPPAVAVYAGPTAVTTTRYGLFGRPRATVTRYYP
jgi:hypothetical protein